MINKSLSFSLTTPALLLVMLLAFCFSPAVFAEEAAYKVSQKILIHNITFVDPDHIKKDTIASLVIKDKLFDLVTKDQVEVSITDIIFDAQKGFLLGSLEPGKVANFLILDANPHKNIDALLDTKKHILLAIKDGVIIRNNLKIHSNLSPITEQEKAKTKAKRKATSWLAYTPPPIIIPANYKNANWINFDNDYFSTILIGALALDKQTWQSQDQSSKLQVGDLQSYNGGEIRGLRFGVAGTIKLDTPWIYMVTGETKAFDQGFDSENSDTFSFLDWRLDIPTFLNTTLSIGKQKEPISMERTIGLIFLPMQERSLSSDVLMPARNVGAVLSGSALEQHVTWASGIFNNWLEDDGSFKDNSTQVVGRTTWLPYFSDDHDALVHLGFGLRYSNAKEDIRFASEPEFSKSPLFIDSGDIIADSTLTYNLEASWRKGPIWLSGEYSKTKVTASDLQDPELSGYNLNATFSLTGEMRDYNRKSGVFSPMSVARSVQQGGMGAIEISSRWSVFKGNNKGIQAGDSTILSTGISWWLTSKFNLSFNYRWITLDRCSFIQEQCDLEGKTQGFNSRITLLL